jgi:GT2 family glycosyltransferase
MEYLDDLKASQADLPLTIIPLQDEQTLGELHNALAEHAQGELLLFLYNDTLAASELWLDELSALCDRPDVVAVSPRVVSFGSRLRSKVALADMGEDIHISLAGLSATDPGYMQRAHSTQALQQLSPGCLMVNAKAFKEVGGFSQNADDGLCVRQLCLLLRKNGGKLLWTPNVTLVSYETMSPSGWPGVTPAS